MRSKSFLLLATLVSCSDSAPVGGDPSWKRLELGPFTMAVPSELEEQKVRGIDSYVGVYGSPAMRVSFDYGAYSDPLEDDGTLASHEYRIVDNQNARIVVYKKSSDPDLTRAAAVYFEAKPEKHAKLTLYAVFRDAEQLATALKIFESVRFASN